MNISIDKNSSVPTITDNRTDQRKISSRELTPGDRLPTERELSEAIHIQEVPLKELMMSWVM